MIEFWKWMKISTMKSETKEKGAKKFTNILRMHIPLKKKQKNKHNTKLQWNPLDAFMWLSTKTNPLLTLNEFRLDLPMNND